MYRYEFTFPGVALGGVVVVILSGGPNATKARRLARDHIRGMPERERLLRDGDPPLTLKESGWLGGRSVVYSWNGDY